MKLAGFIPGLRVPKVHDAWEEEYERDEEGIRTTGYIVMDYISGKTLREAWPSMSKDARDAVQQQLLETIKTLHGYKLASPGPVGGGISRGFYLTQCGAPDFTGAFGDLVFCHMDLHMSNIILDSGNNIWFLDWDGAGGYPAFFEEAHLPTVGSEPEKVEFYEGVLKLLWNGAHSQDIRRLKDLSFAVTTGWRLKQGDRIKWNPL